MSTFISVRLFVPNSIHPFVHPWDLLKKLYLVVNSHGVKISLDTEGRVLEYYVLGFFERCVEHHKKNQAPFLTGSLVSFLMSTRFSMSTKIPILHQKNVNKKFLSIFLPGINTELILK